jgi:hypothetical protein
LQPSIDWLPGDSGLRRVLTTCRESATSPAPNRPAPAFAVGVLDGLGSSEFRLLLLVLIPILAIVLLISAV